MRESVIENYLVKQVKAIGGECIKMNPHNVRGLPDRGCFFKRGLVVMIECKAPGKKPRANQIYWLKKFQNLSIQATYIDSRPKVDAFITWVKKEVTKRNASGCDVTQQCVRRQCPLRLTEKEIL